MRTKISTGFAGVLSIVLTFGLVVPPAQAATFSGGMLSSNLTLTAADSPYTITSTIQIPAGVTLNIEPGVTINAPGLDKLFWINGSINLVGSAASKIRIKGSPNKYFFLQNARNASVVIKHTLINGKGVGSLIPATGYEQNASFLVEDSEFIDIPGFNYLWYPLGAQFSRNVFKGLGGFGGGTSGRNITFQDNLFIGDASDYYGSRFWIEAWANYSGAVIGVYGNEFRNTTVNVITGKVNVAATGNYWGTTDLAEIEKKVEDKFDSLSYSGVVDYSSPLVAPGVSPSSSIIIDQGPTEITPGTVSISGTLKSGNTLTANAQNFDPVGTAYTYQWKRDGSNITGASGATYTLSTLDIGKQISVSVTATYASLPSAVVSSPPTSQIAAPDPIQAGRTYISGSSMVGETLTAVTTGWAPNNLTFTYVWKRSGVAIVGATSSQFRVTPDDAGNFISVTVTAAATGLSPLSVTSTTPTRVSAAPLEPVQPSVWGVPRVGSVVTAITGFWGYDGVSYSYEWFRGSFRIPGASGLTYKLNAQDLGQSISVKVTGTYPGVESDEAQSAPVSVLAALETSPVIRSINTKAVAEGKKITITGENLNEVDSVLFTGGKSATIVSKSETSITVLVPIGAETGKVTLASLDGSAQTSTLKILKPSPVVSSVSPGIGKTGTKITIKGKNFSSVSRVQIGSTSIPFIRVSSTQINASITLAVKSGKVSITSNGATINTSKNFAKR